MVARREGAIGAQTLAPGACISEIARRNGIVPSLLFTCRRRARDQAPNAEPVLLPIQVPEPATTPVPIAAPVKRRRRKVASTIEIDLRLRAIAEGRYRR